MISDAATRAVARLLDRTVEGPTVRPELGPCLDYIGKVTAKGYVNCNVDGKCLRGSRIVLAVALRRALKPGHMALHKCDRPCCLRESHLYEGTAFDNMKDRNTRSGHTSQNPDVARRISATHRSRSAWQGEAHPKARLNAEAVKVIRFLAARGVSCSRLAAAHGMSEGATRHVIRGTSWPHLNEVAA